MVLKDCRSGMIYGVDGKPLVKTKVWCSEEDIQLFFEKEEQLSRGRIRVPVDFYDGKEGCVKTFCELDIQKNSPLSQAMEEYTARCRILKVLDKIQRQKDVRVTIKKEMSFFSPSQGAFYGVIQNISAGGIYITTTQPMSRHELFSFVFEFVKKERTVIAMTLWAKKLQGDYYGYGCKFVDLSKSTEMDIRQFVYRQQQFSLLFGKDKGEKGF